MMNSALLLRHRFKMPGLQALLYAHLGALLCLGFWYLAFVFLVVPVVVVGGVMFACRMMEAGVFRKFFDAEMLATDESIWIYDSPTNRSIINTVLEFDGYVSVAELRAAVMTRLIESRDETSGEARYPRFVRRIKSGLFNYYLVRERSFNIDDHVIAYRKGKDYSRNELNDILTQVSSRPFEHYRSPWEYVVVHIRSHSMVQTTAVVFRIHHCLADGTSLTDMLSRQLPDVSPAAPVEYETMTRRQKTLLTIRGLFFSPLALIKMTRSIHKITPIHSHGQMSGTKVFAWSAPLNLDLIRNVRTRLKVTVNDVIVGCIAKALGDYFVEQGAIDGDARDVLCSIPVDTRISSRESREFGVKAAFVQVRLPTSVTDSVEAVMETKRRMDSIKRTGDAFASRFYMRVFGFLLPAKLFNRLVLNFSDKAPVTVANLPGPKQPVQIAGQRMRFLSFFPPHRGETTMGVSVFSYAGRYVIGVESDDAVVRDPSVICRKFSDAVEELSRSVGVFMTNVE